MSGEKQIDIKEVPTLDLFSIAIDTRERSKKGEYDFSQPCSFEIAGIIAKRMLPDQDLMFPDLEWGSEQKLSGMKIKSTWERKGDCRTLCIREGTKEMSIRLSDTNWYRWLLTVSFQEYDKNGNPVESNFNDSITYEQGGPKGWQWIERYKLSSDGRGYPIYDF